MKARTLFLKLALAILTGIVLLFNIFLFPRFPRTNFAQWCFSIAIFTSALLFYFTAFQAFVILRLVDQNLAFSEVTLGAVRRIKLSTFAIGVSYIGLLPQIYWFADMDDAPGLVLIGGCIVLLPFIISLFVAVLQALLQNAIDIKKENDLTV